MGDRAFVLCCLPMEYTHLASQESLEQTVAALKARNVEAMVVEDGAAALEQIKALIPAGASVMNGASRTLEQIGFVEYLKAGTHGWNNLHAGILAEQDPVKQAGLRKQATLSDYYLGSVHALAQTGEFIVASNTGSQLPHIAFTSSHLIFVVSAKKIVPTFADTYTRLNEHVIPLEDENMRGKYGMGTTLNKILVFLGENPMIGRTVRIILVKEDLGF